MQIDEQKITDADILRLIAEFDEWRAEAGVSANGGLWQMLAFLRDSIQSGEGLYVRMLDRQRQHARGMAVYALDHPYDAALAANYLSEALHGNPADLDYDGALFICGDYIDTISNLIESTLGPQLGATYNTIFSWAIDNRLGSYWSVYRGDHPRQSNYDDVERPVIVDILHLGFNIPMFVDSMQLGLGAWGAGERIALLIDRHIRSARSHGQLCSLYPLDIPVPVDWRRNTWARKSELLDYLDRPFRGNEPLPEWAKDWMKNGTA